MSFCSVRRTATRGRSVADDVIRSGGRGVLLSARGGGVMCHCGPRAGRLNGAFVLSCRGVRGLCLSGSALCMDVCKEKIEVVSTAGNGMVTAVPLGAVRKGSVFGARGNALVFTLRRNKYTVVYPKRGLGEPRTLSNHPVTSVARDTSKAV